MSDIVERLRARDAYLSLDEAADEIDRLREALRLIANNERLRGLLHQARDHLAWHLKTDVHGVPPLSIVASIDAALAGTADQPSALPERCSVCGGAHDVGNPCRATSPTKAGQPERCCLDYPRCDCNSPPEPDNEWHCSQYPGCECFAGCREKALEVPL